jgi:hypothetical protein
MGNASNFRPELSFPVVEKEAQSKVMNRATYKKVRHQVREGDLIAFNGRGFASSLIRRAQKKPPTHVAIVQWVPEAFPSTPDGPTVQRLRLLESTSLKHSSGKRTLGVQTTYLSERLKTYEGEIWWLPLSDLNRRLFNKLPLANLLSKYEGTKYDFWQVFRLGWRFLLPSILPIKESDRFLFCSELVAFLYKQATILPKSINASEVTPADLVSYTLYQDNYVLLKGKYIKLTNFNSTFPGDV